MEGFLNYGTTDSLGQMILQCGGCLLHCRMCDSFLGLYPLDNSKPHPTPRYDNLQCL